MDASSLFDYIMIPPAIVIGLALTHVLTAAGRIVHRRSGYGDAIRLDWVHLIWVVHILIWIVFWWWYSYAWTSRSEWDFLIFLFLIVYSILLYVMSVILMPSDLDEVTDFSEYFMSLRKWFFGGVILLILVDFADTAVKGWEYFKSIGIGYPMLRTTMAIGSILAIYSKNRTYHGFFAVIFFVWTFLFFWLNRPTLSVV